MDTTLFDELQTTVRERGGSAAIERLCDRLLERKDYTALFYALLMKGRHELGVLPLPTGSSADIAPQMQEKYETVIRESARRAGRLFLDDGNIPQAWAYFRMINEPQSIVEALDRFTPAEGDDVEPLIGIAFGEGVHPKKGFDWVLDRYGLCSSITTLSSHQLPSPEVRRYCIGKVVRALHNELSERLISEVERHDGTRPAETTITALIAGRDWLFAEEFAHIDTSHLSSVVQMSLQMEPGPELNMARELCAYGQRLSPRLQYPGDPPFDDLYVDHGIYLGALAGDHIEAAVGHFRLKAEQAASGEGETLPAEVLVNLLLRLNRPKEALKTAAQFLSETGGRQLSCPGIPELCEKAGDFGTLTELARRQGDPVHFVAGLIAAGGK